MQDVADSRIVARMHRARADFLLNGDAVVSPV
jgi:hypothetical protein